MNKKAKIAIFTTAVLLVVVLAGAYLHGQAIPVLQPAGQIGQKERNLIIFGVALSLLVVVPVFGILGVVAWKYREGNTKKQRYSPELAGSRVAETIWWLVPSLMILIIAVVTWQSSYALDPFKSLSSTQKPLTVQVVALNWKWLFIYPAQHIATVNYVQFPVGTPVNFQITSDAVMNSFWVPSLGGQMYAMPGMSTQLHLMTDKLGSYKGSSANISGKGFADMKFTATAISTPEFETWIKSAQASGSPLTEAVYTGLAADSTNNPRATYSATSVGLYDTIQMKYMMPMHTNSKANMIMQGMKM